MSLLTVLSSVENRKHVLASPSEKEKKQDALDLLRFSKTSFGLGRLFPGQIVEELLIITNPSAENIELQMSIDCENREFDDLDEYVFTIRSAESNSYHHRHKTYFSPFSKAHFRIALKVPSIKEASTLKAVINTTAFFNFDEKDDSENSLPSDLAEKEVIVRTKKIPILASVILPKIECPKCLSINNTPTIKLAAKKGKKVDLKVPIKNFSETSICYNAELISMEPLEEGLIILVNGNGGLISNNGLSLVPITIRAPIYVSAKRIKEILVIRVRGTEVLVSFPVIIELY